MRGGDKGARYVTSFMPQSVTGPKSPQTQCSCGFQTCHRALHVTGRLAREYFDALESGDLPEIAQAA